MVLSAAVRESVPMTVAMDYVDAVERLKLSILLSPRLDISSTPRMRAPFLPMVVVEIQFGNL